MFFWSSLLSYWPDIRVNEPGPGVSEGDKCFFSSRQTNAMPFEYSIIGDSFRLILNLRMITINRAPKRVGKIELILYDIITLVYYCFLLNSTTEDNSLPAIYSSIFLALQTLESVYRHLELEDPLHLNPSISLVFHLCILGSVNMVILLIRLFRGINLLHASLFFFTTLFAVMYFYHELKSKGLKLSSNSQRPIQRVLIPLSLFIFCKITNRNVLQVSLTQLLFLVGNLTVSIELQRVLGVQECWWFGWIQSVKQNQSVWSKEKALVSIMIMGCCLIVLQNICFIFEIVKADISVTILHTFIITVAAYYHNRQETDQLRLN